MKPIAAILAVSLIVAAILSVPHLLGLHWWSYLLAVPVAAFAALVLGLGAVLWMDDGEARA